MHRRLVDRVVQLSNREYEAHYIGVNWPHHIFVNHDFTVIGATNRQCASTRNRSDNRWQLAASH